MNASINSKDIITSLALQYDLPTLLNYCQTSKRINDLTCNNNFFWILKLKKDFGISFNDVVTDIREAKDYYKKLTEWIRKYPDINRLYFDAISDNRLDLLKIALHRRADINYQINNMSTPLVRAFYLGFDEIFDYLLEQGAVDTKKKALLNITSFINYMNTSSKNTKIRTLITLYDKVFPRMYKIPQLEKFWGAALDLLERERQEIPDLYNRHINQITLLHNA